jgi:protein ImuA
MMPETPTHLALVDLSGRRREDADPRDLVARMAREGVHELAGAGFGDHAAAAGLAVAALAAHGRPGPVLWIAEAALLREHGRTLARGLAAAGLDPGRVLSVRAPRALDALRALEEGLRSGAVAAVVAELTEAGFTATRRLSLATEASGVPALLLLPHTRGGATAAQARWRVAAAPSAGDPHDPRAPGAARWRVTLERSRLAPRSAGRRFDLEVEDETLSLRVADGLAARPAEADGRRRAG